MIVIINKHGQLANRIWAYISSVIKAIDTEEKVIILCFDEYFEAFENLNCISNIIFFAPFRNTYSTFFFKQLYFLYSTFLAGTAKVFHLYGTYFKGALLLIHGWETRNDDMDLSKKNIARKIFELKKDHVKDICNRISEERKKYKNLVTVHIRRGDYKTYKNGKYYFEDDTFYYYMKQIANCLGIEQTLFTICSNEIIDLSHFPGLYVKQFKENDSTQDLQVMLSSDYIVGVPSTFSRWSSFINNIPCYLIQSKDTPITITDFKIIKTLDFFEDDTPVFLD